MLLRSPLFLFLMRKWNGGTPPQKIQQFFSFRAAFLFLGGRPRNSLLVYLFFGNVTANGPQKKIVLYITAHLLSRGASVCPAAEPLTKNVLQRNVRLQQFGGGGPPPPPLLFALFVAPSVSSAPLLCSGVFKSHLCASPKLAQRTQTRDSPLSYHVS